MGAHIKAVLVNGSPRKSMNTAKLLAEAVRGAQDARAETETVHLYDLAFTSCKSCMGPLFLASGNYRLSISCKLFK